MPAIKQGTVNIEGHTIDIRMADYAKDVASQSKEFLQELSQSKVLCAPGAVQRAAELGSQEQQGQQQGQQKAQEKAGAESVPKAAEMAM